MRILIIGAGDPIPSFISRRLKAYAGLGMDVMVVANSKASVRELSGVKAIDIGGVNSFAGFCRNVLTAAFHFVSFFRLFSLKRELDLKQRLLWSLKYFPITLVPSPDVIHFQWLALAAEFGWLRHYFSCPMVGSARGSQVTIYPFTRSGFSVIIDKAIKEVDFIHCVSEDLMEVCRNLGAPAEKLFVNYNGIDTSRFKPRQDRECAGDITIVSVGALMWRKGYLYQLLSLKELLRNGLIVKLLLVGEGPDREGLLYTANKLGLSESVVFSGNVAEETVAKLLSQSDIYVSTSIAEGLPNSVVEAAASGLPIVAFACEGIREIVANGENGFVVPFGDIAQMVEHLAFLVQNVESRKKLGDASRERAVRLFDETYWVNRMVENFKEFGKH
jgi:colanic acid/amylovoran biosynthesis glycosyltransferase